MADYKQSGNRWTAIFLVDDQHGKGDKLYRRLPFEICRFNVDTNPNAREVIVPIGEDVLNADGTKADFSKIYERIWLVSGAEPYNPGGTGKVYFGTPE